MRELPPLYNRVMSLPESSSSVTNLTNHCLLAMPNMADPNFDETLVLIAEHSEAGAMGVVINRAMAIDLAGLFERINLSLPARPVLYGGPVQPERGFVLHRPGGQWQASQNISDEIALTTSRDILDAMAEGRGPEQVMVALGYSGWGPGQLENELRQNAWLAVPADWSLIYETPLAHRLSRAYSLLGIDRDLFHGTAGHA